MFRKTMLMGVTLASALAMASTQAKTIRIAEHRQARIDALNKVVPEIEKKYNVHIEVIEYPAPEKDYLTKLLTELRAGNAPDIFNVPHGSDVSDTVAAGYLAPITTELKAWEGYSQLFDVGKLMATNKDGQIYALPAMLDVMQVYYRRDIFEKAGISTEQPKTWAELLDRAKAIKAKTGAYGLLFPAGLTWGTGSFEEGFRLLIVGTSTPQIASEDGKLNLTGQGIKDSFGFYADLINSDLMPIQPLLEPEPWVVPKYEMFPAGKLVATTGGSWGYIYDWGPQSKNPIPNVTQVVGTWEVPGKEGGEYVLVDLNGPWAVNAKSPDVALAKKILLELASVKAVVAYAQNLGNIPGRADAATDPEFQKLTELVPILDALKKGSGTYLKTGEGFSTVAEGVARATEALLRKKTDAAGAQKILVDYVKEVNGDDTVK
jgi:multiple sugar transport system substrate-binding protein